MHNLQVGCAPPACPTRLKKKHKGNGPSSASPSQRLARGPEGPEGGREGARARFHPTAPGRSGTLPSGRPSVGRSVASGSEGRQEPSKGRVHGSAPPFPRSRPRGLSVALWKGFRSSALRALPVRAGNLAWGVKSRRAPGRSTCNTRSSHLKPKILAKTPKGRLIWVGKFEKVTQIEFPALACRFRWEIRRLGKTSRGANSWGFPLSGRRITRSEYIRLPTADGI